MSKKSGINRTLKYGVIYAEKVFSMIIIIAGIYALIYYLQGGFGDIISDSLMIPFYMGEMCLIMLFIIQIMNKSRYIPLSISFGSLRKETFIGIQWINLILIVQSVILVGVCLIPNQSISGEMKSMGILIFALLLVALGGIGQLIAAVSIKFGKLGGFLIAGLIFVLITSAIVVLALVGEINTNITIDSFPSNIKILAIIVAVIVYICGSYINYRVLKNYEVRA